MNITRKGITLVELLVVLGIILLLLMMALPAIMRVNSIAETMNSRQNLRVLMGGFQQYAAARGGRLPGASLDNQVNDPTRYPLYVILPYLDVGFSLPWGKEGNKGMEYPVVKYYLSPTDPSVNNPHMPMVKQQENTSYSTNAMVFDGINTLGSIDDGLSYTIGMAERYRGCFHHGMNINIFVSRGVYPILGYGTRFRTSTFADRGYEDVYPITVNRISKASTPGVTFQATPALEDADGTMLQSTQSEGLLTIMMDGSIRVFAKGVKEEVFWGAVTAKGNEIIRFDDP